MRRDGVPADLSLMNVVLTTGTTLFPVVSALNKDVYEENLPTLQYAFYVSLSKKVVYIAVWESVLLLGPPFSCLSYGAAKVSRGVYPSPPLPQLLKSCSWQVQWT